MRELVCSLGCAVFGHTGSASGCYGEIDPHHSPGKSEKPNSWSDLQIIGLCRIHHDEAEGIGDERFQAKYQMDFRVIQLRYNQLLIEQFGLGGLPVIERKPTKSTRKNRIKREPYRKPWEANQ